MWMTSVCFLMLGLLAVSAQKPAPSVSTPGTYMITYGRNIRPGIPVVMTVEIMKADRPVQLTAELVNQTSNTVHASAVKSFTAGKAGELIVDIPADLSRPHNYGELRFNFTGTGGLEFTDTGKADFNNKNVSVFIQTDKAMYKPGQTVKFRILATYSDLKVVRVPMDIYVMDADGNRIRQWLKQTASKGVYEGEFTTSMGPVLGTWTIKVQLPGLTETKTLEIAEYVLPKFEASVELPSIMLVDSEEYQVTVRAKYTFGKPVDGNARVRYGLSYYYGRWRRRVDERNSTRVKMVKLSGGKGHFTIKKLELQQLAFDNDMNYANKNRTVNDIELRYRSVKVDVNVTEALTGKKMKASTEGRFDDTLYKMQFLDFTPRVYKPGLVYKAYLKVTLQDDSLIPQSDLQKINISATYNVERQVTKNTQPTTPKPTTEKPTFIPSDKGSNDTKPSRRLPSITIVEPHFVPYPTYDTYPLNWAYYTVGEDGMIFVEFQVPKNASSISLKADGMNATTYLYASRSYSPSENYAQLDLITKKPKAGKVANFELRTTEPITKAKYQIISKGRLVDWNDVTQAVSQHGISFPVRLTSAMSPSADIVVFYERDDGEIVADSLSITVDGTFENKIGLKFSKTNVKPGTPVELEISADPDSTVYLLTVDKSVLLLKKGNDITEKKVKEELMTYSWGSYYPYSFYMFVCYWPISSGGRDAQGVFDGAKLEVVTDANVYQRPRRNYWRGDVMFSANRGPSEALAGGMARPQSPPPSAPQGFQAVERVRKFFPERWLWDAVVIGSTGKEFLVKSAPDTITTWVASAFAVHPTTGLSVAPETANLTTFRKLFISINLPYSWTRYQIVCPQVSIFNYYAPGEIPRPIFYQFTPGMLTLKYNSDFEVFQVKERYGQIEYDSYSTQSSKLLDISAETTSAYFCINATKIGTTLIEVELLSLVPGDAVQRQILVEAEGVERSINIPMLVDLRNDKRFSKTVSVNFPKDRVRDSERLKITVAGDILGSTLKNLNNLLRMPYGCGEQNMLNFAPNIYVRKYLDSTGRLTQKDIDLTEKYMISGYERELKYRHRDGSYSAFGEPKGKRNFYGDRSGSMWLTAFVTKCFVQAADLIPDTIDQKVIEQALEWMVRNQAKNGSFLEPGRVFNSRLKGGSSRGEALTAYAIITLAEANEHIATMSLRNEVKKATDRAVQYLESRLPVLTKPYDVAIVTYALKLVGSSSVAAAESKLETLAINGDGLKYWGKRDKTPAQDRNRYWSYRKTEALNIETTAYALLSYAIDRKTTKGLPVLRWLNNQRNDNGGFISTQDTVLALQALSEFARDVYVRTGNSMTVSLTVGAVRKTFSLTKENSLLLQSEDFKADLKGPSTIKVEGKGSGVAVVQISMKYNEVLPGGSKLTLKWNIMKRTSDYFLLHVCGQSTSGEIGMSIMEIGVPVDYDANLDGIDQTARITRKEMLERKVILYFNEITEKPTCVNVEMFKVRATMSSTPNPIRLYDYYEPNTQVTDFYQLKSTKTPCEQCPECDNSCKKPN